MRIPRIRINLASLIPLIFICWFATHTSLSELLYRWGFGVGFGLFSSFLFVALITTNVPRNLSVLSYISLGFLGLSYLASIEFQNNPNPIAFTFSLLPKLNLFYWLFPIGVSLSACWLWISYLVSSTLGNGWKVQDPICEKEWLSYARTLVFSPCSMFLSFFYAFLNSLRNGFIDSTVFQETFYVSTGIIIWLIGSWLLILFITRRRKNDLVLAKCMSNKGFAQFNIKKPLFIGFGIFLVICTLFEAFRGLWWVWFGTAIWLILMFASLWKHVFDVPTVAEKTGAPIV
jgi:MFS family permease